jgi:hypothetical protein
MFYLALFGLVQTADSADSIDDFRQGTDKMHAQFQSCVVDVLK